MQCTCSVKQYCNQSFSVCVRYESRIRLAPDIAGLVINDQFEMITFEHLFWRRSKMLSESLLNNEKRDKDKSLAKYKYDGLKSENLLNIQYFDEKPKLYPTPQIL